MIPRERWLSSAVRYPGKIDSAQYDIPGRLTQRSMISWEDWLSAAWYPGKIDSAQYDTPGRLTQRSMIPWEDWLSTVWYPGKIDSAQYDTREDWLSAVWYPGKIDSGQYDTPGRLTQRSMIPQEDWLSAVWYPAGEIVSFFIFLMFFSFLSNILHYEKAITFSNKKDMNHYFCVWKSNNLTEEDWKQGLFIDSMAEEDRKLRLLLRQQKRIRNRYCCYDGRSRKET